MAFSGFSGNLLQGAFVSCQKSVDDFEDSTQNMVIWVLCIGLQLTCRGYNLTLS